MERFCRSASGDASYFGGFGAGMYGDCPPVDKKFVKAYRKNGAEHRRHGPYGHL